METQDTETGDTLERAELTFLLGMAFQLVLSEFVSRLSALGYADLRPVHGLVFQALRAGATTSSELADILGVTKQAAGQIVDDLAAKGYVRRAAHPAGGRRRLVVLTEKAETHLAVAGDTLHELEAELAGKLPGTSGAPGLGGVRRDLARIIRAMAGDAVPPLRPVW